MDHLLSPPTYRKIEEPIIFLAGPIQGAANWQEKAIFHLSSAPFPYIANPRRNIKWRGEFSPAMYDEQVDWETHHLRLAAKQGVILFWLANEYKHRCERAYAQTTRFELGEWKIRHERDGVKLVVGIDDNFSGKRYIQRRFPNDCPDVPLCLTLEETCKRALELIS